MQGLQELSCTGENDGLRFVGDPIDVVTGAFIENTKDFQIADATPIVWRRLYSTRDIGVDRGLGVGHTHSFDHRLRLDLDGIRYRAPTGLTVDFPAFPTAAPRVATRGYILVRRDRQLGVDTPDGLRLVFDVGTTTDARLTEMRTSTGTVRLGYDGAGRLLSLSNDQDSFVALTWDATHIITADARRSGDAQPTRVASYRYDGNRLIEFEDGYRALMRYVHDTAGRIIARADRRDYKFGFRYDADGRCIHSAAEDGVLEVKLEYFPLEKRTVVTKSDGGVWQYFYNDVGTLTTIIDGEGATRSFVPRASDGQIELEVDGAGNELAYEYDVSGRQVGKRDAAGRALTPSDGHRVPTNAVEYEFGALYRLPNELPDASINTQAIPSTIIPFLSVAGTPHAGQLRSSRDLQGLLLREERDGTVRRFAYDSGGNLRWDVDFEGARTEYKVLSFNQLRGLTDASGNETNIEYTLEDTGASVTDSGGTRTVYARNKRSEIVAVGRAGAWRDRYVRDGAGRLVERHGATSLLYTIVRGPQGEILERNFASGGFERYVYDDRMRVVSAATLTDNVTFAYDKDGNRVTDERDKRGVRRELHGGALAELAIHRRFITRYRTDGDARSVTDPTGRTHRFRNVGSGLIVREQSNGKVETTQYDVDGRCLVRIVECSSGHRWVRRFERSAEGYLKARHDSAVGITHYQLDASHRLVAEHRPTGSLTTFQYDIGGNLVQLGAAKIFISAGNLLAACGSLRFSHDTRQAVAREESASQTRLFFRDDRDQLTRVNSFCAHAGPSGAPWNAETWSATYDALNRRTSKTSSAGTTEFIWDGDRLAAERAPNGQLRLYIYADDFAMTPFAIVDYANGEAAPSAGDVYFVYSDHQGCPERVENLDGGIVWSAIIDAYGFANVTVGADFHQPLRWPGHYFDGELGLNYNRFRTYAPRLGRYLEPDPLGRAGGRENVYAYTHNPLHTIDVDGNFECPVEKQKKIDRRKKAEKEDEEAFAAELDAMSKRKRESAAEEADARVQALKEGGASEAELMAARRERYVAECAAAGPPPKPVMPYNEWEAAAVRAQDNSSRGRLNEDAALDSAGLDNNNNGNPPKTYGKPPNQTRPDAFSKGKAVDVKSVPDTPGPDGEPRKVYDTDQMNKQRNGAANDPDGEKGHAVIISNGDRDNVEPSGPLADKSTVVHHNPDDDSWSKWTPANEENGEPGGWDDISKRTARRMLNSPTE